MTLFIPKVILNKFVQYKEILIYQSAAMSTLFRSKDSKEVQQLEKEGAKAISLQPDEPVIFEDESYVMVVGEERIVLQPHALEDPPVKELIKTLLNWINDVLEGRRIIVRDIIEDIYDGQVLGELLAELTQQELDVIPVTQSTYMQKNKLKFLLGKVDQLLGITPEQRKWSVRGIHSQEVVEIFHLLVALARHFRCPHPLPRHVQIKRIHLKQLENKLETKLFVEEITGADIGPTAPLKRTGTERDVFDKLFDEAPEKLEPVKRSLCQFCSKVLEELEIVINDLETQFQSGVNMVLMMGLLEGYYIPHYLWHYTPKTFEERLDNVKLAFKLLEDAGIPQDRAKPEDIVHKDLKSTLRVLYSIFGKYKSHFQQQQQQQPHPPATPTSPGNTSAV